MTRGSGIALGWGAKGWWVGWGGVGFCTGLLKTTSSTSELHRPMPVKLLLGWLCTDALLGQPELLGRVTVFFFLSLCKFAFQCLREPCYFLQSTVTQGLAEAFPPSHIWMKQSRECNGPNDPPPPFLTQTTGLDIFVPCESQLSLCRLSSMCSAAACVTETFCLSCESATLKKEQLSVLLFAAALVQRRC